MLPRITVEGRLGAEPELRFTQSGKAVARLRIVAADRRKNEHTGEWEDADTLWLDVTAFDKLAENVCESLVKGDLALVHGKLRTEEWNDRDTNQKRSKISMIADSIGPSLVFRVTPHGGGQRSAPRERLANPVNAAYGGADDPPF